MRWLMFLKTFLVLIQNIDVIFRDVKEDVIGKTRYLAKEIVLTLLLTLCHSSVCGCSRSL